MTDTENEKYLVKKILPGEDDERFIIVLDGGEDN